MPQKYPGGYAIIDLKGLDISTTSQDVVDPDIVSVFDLLYNDKLNKPVYITNFTYGGDNYGPVLLRDNIDGADSMNSIELTPVGEYIQVSVSDVPEKVVITAVEP